MMGTSKKARAELISSEQTAVMPVTPMSRLHVFMLDLQHLMYVQIALPETFCWQQKGCISVLSALLVHMYV